MAAVRRDRVVASGIAAGLVLALHARTAFAARHADVLWAASTECSIESAVEAEVDRLLEHLPAPERPLEVRASVTVAPDGGFRLTLEIDDGDRRLQRELRAPACDELARPAAVVIALAIDPEAAARALEIGDREPSVAAVPPLPSSEPAPSGEPARAPEHALAPVAEPPVPRDRGPESSSRDALRVHVRVAAVADFGALPEPSLGPGVALGVGAGRFRAEVGGFLLPARRATIAGDETKGGDIELVAATATACWLGMFGSVEIGPCAGADLGVVHGEGFGVSEPASGELAFVALRAGALLAWSLDSRWSLELAGGPVARVGRGAFVLEGMGAVHEPAPVGARLDAGVAVRFP